MSHSFFFFLLFYSLIDMSNRFLVPALLRMPLVLQTYILFHREKGACGKRVLYRTKHALRSQLIIEKLMDIRFSPQFSNVRCGFTRKEQFLHLVLNIKKIKISISQKKTKLFCLDYVILFHNYFLMREGKSNHISVFPASHYMYSQMVVVRILAKFLRSLCS